MAESIATRRLAWNIIFLAICAFLVFVHLLPSRSGIAGLPGPDLFVALIFAWVLRRPDYVPALLIALVMLTVDFVFLRPPGLWAAIVVLGAEVLRRREPANRDLPFLLEWLTVAIVITGMTLARSLILLVLFVDQPPFGLTLIQMILTILSYPAAVALTVVGLGLRRAAPGETDELGRRL